MPLSHKTLIGPTTTPNGLGIGLAYTMQSAWLVVFSGCCKMWVMESDRDGGSYCGGCGAVILENRYGLPCKLKLDKDYSPMVWDIAPWIEYWTGLADVDVNLEWGA